jgi:Rhodopirellula transposase DDE domain
LIRRKKELVGNYRNADSDWRPKADPQRVNVHDFEKLDMVAPCGVYDIAADAGWVSVGITCDTAEFAVASIRTGSKGSAGRAIRRNYSVIPRKPKS